VNKYIIILEQVIVSLSNFILAILLARLLGVEGFGSFSVIWLIILLINSLHQAVIVLPLMSFDESIRNEAGYRDRLYQLQIFFLLFSLLIFTAAYFSLGVFVPLMASLYLPSLVVMVFYHMHDYFRRLLFLDKKTNLVVFSSIVAYMSRYVFIGAWIFAGKMITLDAVFWSIALSFGLGVLVASAKYQIFSRIDLCSIRRAFRLHWKTSKWLIPSGLMQWTSINFYILLAATILSPVAVAAIRVGQNLTQVVNVFLLAGENYFPLIASDIYQQRGLSGCIHYLLKVSLVFIGFILSASPVVVIYRNELVDLIYGDEYVQFSYVLLFYMLITILMVIMMSVRILFRVIGSTRPWFYGYMGSSLLTLFFSFPLVNNFGVKGALVGMIVSQFVLLLVSLWNGKLKVS